MCDHNQAVHGQETLPRPLDAINSDMPTKQDQTFMAQNKMAKVQTHLFQWLEAPKQTLH